MRYWYRVVALCFLGWIFMYADRTVLSPVLPMIGQEFRLNESQLGLISSLFFLAYTALQIPTGILADRYSRKRVLILGYLVFGVGTILSGLAGSYGLLLAGAVITGLGESTYYPTQFAISSSTIPTRHRGVMLAIINSGQAVGVSLGLLLSSYFSLELGLGWRTPFIVLGVGTIATALLFTRAVREPARPENSGPTASGRSLLGVAFGNRNLVLVYCLNFCSLYGFFMVLTWLPYYLITDRGYHGTEVGVISSLVVWTSVPGALLWSYLSDRIGRLGLIRLLSPLACLSLLAVPYAGTYPLLVIALCAYGLVGKLAMDPVIAALVADLAPRAAYGTVYGVLNFAGMASSILAPVLTGWIAASTGSLLVGFYVASAFMLVGTGLTLALRHSQGGVPG